MIVYIVVPIVVLLCVAFLLPREDMEQDKRKDYLRLLPHVDPKERLGFLENYFSNQNRQYVTNYLQINQNVSIIRDYSAGSNATTMLCMDKDTVFFRKYAFGEEGEKLYQQVCWLEANAGRVDVPRILKKEKTQLYCYYDMPYTSNSVGLFEYIHTMPLEKGWGIIRNVIDTLENSIYQIQVSKANPDSIREYVKVKVKGNLEKIKSAKRIRELQKYKTIVINGLEYRNLSFYEQFLEEEYLYGVFKDDNYAIIHGDLTIENIICERNLGGENTFYIIDPNTGNIHESPNLDYGKLLQSIHGGYEFLMSTKEVSVSENRIDFVFTKSSTYIELHKLLKNYMNEKFGVERTRSIYFHEIVHWLRLMPYKIEKDGKRALLFYAGLLMVMQDVVDQFGE